MFSLVVVLFVFSVLGVLHFVQRSALRWFLSCGRCRRRFIISVGSLISLSRLDSMKLQTSTTANINLRNQRATLTHGAAVQLLEQNRNSSALSTTADRGCTVIWKPADTESQVWTKLHLHIAAVVSWCGGGWWWWRRWFQTWKYPADP